MDSLTVFIIVGFVILLVWIIFSATNNKTTSHKNFSERAHLPL